MTPSRLSLVSTILALLIFASAVFGKPSPLRNSSPLELVHVTDQATPPQSQNLTFKQWPARPYKVPLVSRSGLPYLVVVLVRPFEGTRAISITGLQDFIRDFRDSIARNYPVPGYIPRTARESYFDVGSYTTWRIDIEEGYFGRRGPTEWALLALNEVIGQLGAYGPAEVGFGVRVKDSNKLYISGLLQIATLGDRPLTLSLANGTRTLETS